MNRNDTVYLQHIAEAIQRIELYMEGVSYEQFMAAMMIQDAVIRQLEIIGEATKNLSLAVREASPDIPWKDIAGMRDILIHQYFGVDVDAVWDSAIDELPMIKKQIARILLELE